MKSFIVSISFVHEGKSDTNTKLHLKIKYASNISTQGVGSVDKVLGNHGDLNSDTQNPWES